MEHHYRYDLSLLRTFIFEVNFFFFAYSKYVLLYDAINCMSIRDQLSFDRYTHSPPDMIPIVPFRNTSYSYLFEEIDITTIEPVVELINKNKE